MEWPSRFVLRLSLLTALTLIIPPFPSPHTHTYFHLFFCPFHCSPLCFSPIRVLFFLFLLFFLPSPVFSLLLSCQMASLVHQRVSKAFDDKLPQGVIVKYFKGYQKTYHVCILRPMVSPKMFQKTKPAKFYRTSHLPPLRRNPED